MDVDAATNRDDDPLDDRNIIMMSTSISIEKTRRAGIIVTFLGTLSTSTGRCRQSQPRHNARANQAQHVGFGRWLVGCGHDK